ncbi:MAG: MFS transporter [Chloroflexi bacterium]|nr:MFS transporter [Chloroflexota bacterium]
MTRTTRLVLLAVLGAGVFLAGLELMITAVALPSIVTDLADWSELRRASWIVNGYLLAYVVAMPLAGRLADLWGVRRLFYLGLAAFTVGSALAGRAQSLDELIAARLVQAVGGGILVPVGTAAASHLFDARLRPRALGVVGALTFLGMAAGPFVGAAVIGGLHPGDGLDSLGLREGPLRDAFDAAWRFVFYINVPIGIVALALAWAASAGFDSVRKPGRADLLGALAFTIAVALLLLGLTLLGDAEAGPETGPLLATAVAATLVAAWYSLQRAEPFLDLRLFKIPAFASAALVSLLTGYGFATAIIGGAVFVDRVLYGGPDDQRLVLGALAAATALGALVSGFVLRRVGLRLTTLAGIALSGGALAAIATWNPSTEITAAAGTIAIFGLGFGLTVTPRSTAAVEAVGRAAFGVASATVTVARMIGMAVGLAILTAYGSTTIERLTAAVYATPDAYKAFIPEALRDRPLRDGLVVEALEAWAADEASRIMVGIFLVAAAVTVVAAVPALRLGRARILGPKAMAARAAPGSEADEQSGTAVAL